jgi:uncharacterized repeat protein (TIGR03803 family)
MLAVLSALLLAAVRPAYGQTETVLYSFDGRATPYYETLALDKEGNIYGTTYDDGAYGYGTVFKLEPSGAETILHSFDLATKDGFYPFAGLVFHKDKLYGTTSDGGAYGYNCGQFGCGSVFEISRTGKETILHSFGASGDGFTPIAAVVFDKMGNIYSTTQYGGTYGYGTVFELTPSGTETILHSFGASGDGEYPSGNLIFDRNGNLYGTTSDGGAYGTRCGGTGCGTVFELTTSGTETILHSFGASGDGFTPLAGLVFDKKGNLYGTTYEGGAYDYGTVFKLTPSGTETVLHNFDVYGDGANPTAGLIFDKKRNLYSTASSGDRGYGVVFELTPSGSEEILWSFEDIPDGAIPFGGLVFDKAGNLYGTTHYGGAYGGGTVYKVTP